MKPTAYKLEHIDASEVFLLKTDGKIVDVWDLEAYIDGETMMACNKEAENNKKIAQ